MAALVGLEAEEVEAFGQAARGDLQRVVAGRPVGVLQEGVAPHVGNSRGLYPGHAEGQLHRKLVGYRVGVQPDLPGFRRQRIGGQRPALLPVGWVVKRQE